SHEMEFEKIIVLDNARINFLYQTIYKTKKEKGKVEFVYHDTSLNQGYLNKRSFGDHFPINYLYSDVIILRIEEKQEIELIIFINDNFNDQNLSQVLAFANSFDHLKAVAKTTICFLNYN